MAKSKETAYGVEPREKAQRRSVADAMSDMSADVRESLFVANVGTMLAQPSFMTRFPELDMIAAVNRGGRAMIIGPPHSCKTATAYAVLGAAQRTCRNCGAPIVRYRDDWAAYVADPAQWSPGAGTLGPPRCRCPRGVKPEGMRGLIVDAELQFDPVWAAYNDVAVGRWDAYREVGVVDAEADGKWSGLKIANDSSLLVLRPTDSDVVLETVVGMMATGAIDIIVVDSIGLLPVKEDEETNRLGSRARFLKRFSSRALASMAESKNKFGAAPTLILINHYMQGPTDNPHQNPNRPVGGLAALYAVDTKIDVSARVNEGLPDDQKRGLAVMRDITFKVSKMRGFTHQMTACARLFVNDYSSSDGRIAYNAGDTDEADRMLALIRTHEEDGKCDERLWRVEKTGGSAKAYWLCGRPFRRLRDIMTFMRRRDVRAALRLPAFAQALPPAAYASLRPELSMFDVDGTPLFNPEDPMFKLLGSYRAKTGGSVIADVQRLRASVETAGGDPVETAGPGGPAPVGAQPENGGGGGKTDGAPDGAAPHGGVRVRPPRKGRSAR